MLADAELVAFVATVDLPGAAAFYGGLLGLECLETSPFAAVYQCGPTTLRVTVAERVQPAPYTVLGWTVTDVAAGVRALADRGVATVRYDGMAQDADGVWTAPSGARVAWFRDPDGHVLSLTQMP